MEETINERIMLFLKTNNITISRAAELFGCSQSALSNKLGGRYRVDLDMVVTLLTMFNELSPDWLLLGEGPMLRKPQINQNNVSGDNIQGDNAVINKGDCVKFIEMLQEKDRQIAELIDIIKAGKV